MINEKMLVWIVVFIVAMLCGLPLNHVTLFWVGIMTIYVMSGHKEE